MKSNFEEKNINEEQEKIASEDSHPKQIIKAHFLFNPKPETSKSRAQREIMLNFKNCNKIKRKKGKKKLPMIYHIVNVDIV